MIFLHYAQDNFKCHCYTSQSQRTATRNRRASSSLAAFRPDRRIHLLGNQIRVPQKLSVILPWLRIVAGLRIVAARPHFDQFFTAQMANLLPAVDGIRLPLGTRINPTRHATWGFRALDTAHCNHLRDQRKFQHL